MYEVLILSFLLLGTLDELLRAYAVSSKLYGLNTDVRFKLVWQSIILFISFELGILEPNDNVSDTGAPLEDTPKRVRFIYYLSETLYNFSLDYKPGIYRLTTPYFVTYGYGSCIIMRELRV